MKTPDQLTTDAVTALLRRSRNRTTQYLCRAYLQFGPEAMDAANLEKLRKAIGGGK